ncbi:hypothetical protein [Devosia sp.]|uniref:hypothetical protein n=1 Tax=Devosia sp. TaxID=1871048 RepID=UPI002635F6A1|nr:hypothetical protein [Devosia sp.]
MIGDLTTIAGARIVAEQVNALGRPSAPDDIDKACVTQAWLAASSDHFAQVTGRYFFHLQPLEPNPEARDEHLQTQLFDVCSRYSGIALPV